MNEHQSKEMFVDAEMAAMTDRPGGTMMRRASTESVTLSLASTPAMTIQMPSRVRRGSVRQHDLTRVLRAAGSAGLKVFGYEVDPTTGKITVNTDAPADKNDPEADLKWWREKHGHKIYRTK
jgi:hypothetical protein